MAKFIVDRVEGPEFSIEASSFCIQDGSVLLFQDESFAFIGACASGRWLSVKLAETNTYSDATKAVST